MKKSFLFSLSKRDSFLRPPVDSYYINIDPNGNIVVVDHHLNEVKQELLVSKAVGSISGQTNSNSTKGYYDIKSPFHNGGSATETAISLGETNTWISPSLTVDSTIDKRPKAMTDRNSQAYDESTGVFKLEGLNTSDFGHLVANFSFDPDEDGGEVNVRLLFSGHSGVSSEESVEKKVETMAQGAGREYTFHPTLHFFISENIDTNGAGDGGTVRFQVNSSVPGTFSFRSLTYYFI